MTDRDDDARPTPRRGLVAIAVGLLLGLGTGPAAVGQAAKEGASGDGSAWRKALPDGAVVELVGISPAPSGPGTWWRPDGSPLPEAPYAKNFISAIAAKGKQEREIAVRFAPPAGAELPSITWQVEPSSGFGTGSPSDSAGRHLRGLESISATLPADRATCTVRFGVASGPWKTEIAHDDRHSSGTKLRDGQISFGKAREVGGKATLCFAEDFHGTDVRVVAIDRAGKAHGAAFASMIHGPFRFHEVEFKLAAGEIKEYHFQTRPYQWAEFRDVPLRPARVDGTP